MSYYFELLCTETDNSTLQPTESDWDPMQFVITVLKCGFFFCWFAEIHWL